MKKILKIFLIMSLLFLNFGCNNSKNAMSESKKYCYAGYTYFSVNNDNVNTNIEVTNVTNFNYHISYLIISFYNDSDLVKEIKQDVDENVDAMNSLNINFDTLNNFKSTKVTIKFYDDDDNEIVQKETDKLDMNDLMSNISYDQVTKTISFDITPQSDFNLDYIELINYDNNSNILSYKFVKIGEIIVSGSTKNITFAYDDIPLNITTYTGISVK